LAGKLLVSRVTKGNEIKSQDQFNGPINTKKMYYIWRSCGWEACNRQLLYTDDRRQRYTHAPWRQRSRSEMKLFMFICLYLLTYDDYSTVGPA